jgi:hypothetical protein
VFLVDVSWLVGFRAQVVVAVADAIDGVLADNVIDVVAIDGLAALFFCQLFPSRFVKVFGNCNGFRRRVEAQLGLVAIQ